VRLPARQLCGPAALDKNCHAGRSAEAGAISFAIDSEVSMRVTFRRLPWLVFTLLSVLPAAAQSRVDPRAISIYPFTGQRGTTFTAVVRATGLGGAATVLTEKAPFRITVDRLETEPGSPTARSKTPVDLVTLRVEIPADAAPGSYPIRLITKHGLSNALPLHIVEHTVIPEPSGSHDTKESAIGIPSGPAVLAGRLSNRGQADYYAFRAQAGETLTFEVVSGYPQILAAGSAATVANFDPSLTIYDPEGSWFDPARLKRIAYNDEPLMVFGRSTDAHLVHRFAKSGTYLLRVEAFAGQGGPDYSYQLKIAPGSVPQDAATPSQGWAERSWTRRLDNNRLNQLSARAGKPQSQKSIESYRAAPEPAVFKIPGSLEGALTEPGETHRARFHVDAPADIAIEVETPAAAPPFFNPIVRLLNQSGEEVATNIFAGLGACSGALTKSTQSKTIVPLRDPGDYTLEIRDATADLAGPEFRYRVQVRPQIPHVGQVRIDTDTVNLTPGEAKTIRVVFDREEGYQGSVVVLAESLPPGVSAATAADFEPDKDPPSAAGKRERYTPRTERAVVVISADTGASSTVQPHTTRLIVRPLIDGKLGEPLLTKSIYVMVIEKP
jgi:hypothetical protein